MTAAPLIFVDLIEDEPKSLTGFKEDRCTDEDCEACQHAYNRYIDHFQPWRILIISGGNHEPLFRSTESYHRKADALHAVDLAFGSTSNVYLREAEHGNKALRVVAVGE